MKIKMIILPAAAVLLSALILFGVKNGLSGIGSVNAEMELNEMLAKVLPGSTFFEWEAYDGEDELIRAVYKGETGFVIQTCVSGYADDIIMLVGVDKNGVVQGLVVREISETYGLGAEALTDTEFLSQFLRTSGDAQIGTNIDAMTGATVSSKAIAKAVNAASAYVTGADTTSSATTWGG